MSDKNKITMDYELFEYMSIAVIYTNEFIQGRMTEEDLKQYKKQFSLLQDVVIEVGNRFKEIDNA